MCCRLSVQVRTLPLALTLKERRSMAFDDIPEDREQSFPCPNEGCDGDITQDKKQGGLWQCNKCDWVPPPKYADYDD